MSAGAAARSRAAAAADREDWHAAECRVALDRSRRLPRGGEGCLNQTQHLCRAAPRQQCTWGLVQRPGPCQKGLSTLAAVQRAQQGPDLPQRPRS